MCERSTDRNAPFHFYRHRERFVCAEAACQALLWFLQLTSFLGNLRPCTLLHLSARTKKLFQLSWRRKHLINSEVTSHDVGLFNRNRPSRAPWCSGRCSDTGGAVSQAEVKPCKKIRPLSRQGLPRMNCSRSWKGRNAPASQKTD